MNVFLYGAIEERLMEQMAAENGYNRLTTFYSDLSIAEYMSGVKGIKDTFRNVVKSWGNDIKYITEFALCLNWKSWEFAGGVNSVIPQSKHEEYAELYSELFYKMQDWIYKHYEKDNEALHYYFEITD